MNIDLHIERLVLDGIGTNPAQLHLLRAALQAHLADALCASHSAIDQSFSARSVSAPSIDVSSGQGTMGREIARSVHAALISGPAARR